MFIGSQYWTALGNSEPPTYPGALGAVSLSGKLISFQSIQVRKADFPPAFFTGPCAAKDGSESVIRAIQEGELHLL